MVTGAGQAPTALSRTVIDSPTVCRRRDAVLREPRWFGCDGVAIANSTADMLIRHTSAVRDRLDSIGLALFQLARPMDSVEFRALATTLGVPEPETDQSLMERVFDGVILNLTSDGALSITEHNQPFTTQPLTYHIEGSRRPAGAGPAYLLFQCLQQPAVDCGGQTIVRSIADTLTTLSEATCTILASTILNPDLTSATVICERASQRTLNFRDPAPAEFRWQSPFADRDVMQALTELLWAIYDPAAAIGIPWRDGMVAVIDNYRWLHARTSGRPGPRHLQRIRVQPRRRPA